MIYQVLIFSLFLLPLTACKKPVEVTNQASTSLVFEEGKDYELIPDFQSGIVPKLGPAETIKVIEFFTYDCDACHAMEPDVRQWLATKPKYVLFEQVPVAIDSQTRSLAHAYYTAQMLGEKTLFTPLLFNTAKTQPKILYNLQSQKQFFIEHDVPEKQYGDIVSSSSNFEPQLLRSNILVQRYQVMALPTVIIANRYKVSLNTDQDNVERFFKVIDYLILKLKRGDA